MSGRPRSMPMSAVIIALVAIALGFAHGHELAGHGAVVFAAGFLVSTAALLAVGLGLGAAVERLRAPEERESVGVSPA